MAKLDKKSLKNDETLSNISQISAVNESLNKNNESHEMFEQAFGRLSPQKLSKLHLVYFHLFILISRPLQIRKLKKLQLSQKNEFVCTSTQKSKLCLKINYFRNGHKPTSVDVDSAKLQYLMVFNEIT